MYEVAGVNMHKELQQSLIEQREQLKKLKQDEIKLQEQYQ